MNCHTQFDLKKFLKIVNNLTLQHKERNLTDSEIDILKGVWKEQVYQQ